MAKPVKQTQGWERAFDNLGGKTLNELLDKPSPRKPEKWLIQLKNLATPIYRGELPKGIYGDLYDAEQLESFMRSLLDSQKQEIVEKTRGMKIRNYPEMYDDIDGQKFCSDCGEEISKPHLGDCDFVLEYHRNSAIDDVLSALEKEGE